jgi:hypothetical protein
MWWFVLAAVLLLLVLKAAVQETLARRRVKRELASIRTLGSCTIHCYWDPWWSFTRTCEYRCGGGGGGNVR